jgi:hypothetical protein
MIYENYLLKHIYGQLHKVTKNLLKSRLTYNTLYDIEPLINHLLQLHFTTNKKLPASALQISVCLYCYAEQNLKILDLPIDRMGCKYGNIFLFLFNTVSPQG